MNVYCSEIYIQKSPKHILNIYFISFVMVSLPKFDTYLIIDIDYGFIR